MAVRARTAPHTRGLPLQTTVLTSVARAPEDRLTRAGKRSRLEASEAALDALAKPEKRQDHENDDDQADDIDDVVHEVTFVWVK